MKDTKTKLLAAVSEQYDRESDGIALHNTVMEILETMDGKKITKRIETAVKKALPDHTVFYNNDYGMFHLAIWGNGIEYNDRENMCLGYADSNREDVQNGIIDSKMFHSDYDCCRGVAAQERNARREDIIDNPERLTAIANDIDSIGGIHYKHRQAYRL